MAARVGIGIFLIGLCAASAIGIGELGGAMRQELFGSAVSLILLGICVLAGSWMTRGRPWVPVALWVVASAAVAASLLGIWIADGDPLARARGPVAAWTAAVALAWAGAVAPRARGRRGAAMAGWLAVLSVLAAGALVEAAVLADLRAGDGFELLLSFLFALAVLASLLRVAVGGGGSEQRAGAGFGSPEDPIPGPPARGGRHARPRVGRRP